MGLMATRPRPKQASLYPRRTWFVEALLFTAGIETLADGILAGSEAAAYLGAGSLIASAVTAAVAALGISRAVRPALGEPEAKRP
jgi:hypothetical protein